MRIARRIYLTVRFLLHDLRPSVKPTDKSISKFEMIRMDLRFIMKGY